MHTLVPIEREPLGPTETTSQGSWLDRRMRLVTSGLERKGGERKRLLIGADSNVAPTEKEGEFVQVSARVEKIVRKPDLEVVLSFPVQGTSGTLQMFANCEVYDYDRRSKGEVLFRGEIVPVDDLDRFILEDTRVMAMVYWKSSRVVTTGKRWKVAKLWKPDPNGRVDVFSLTSWTHVNLGNPPMIDRARNYSRGMSSNQRIGRASSEPPKLLSADTGTTAETEEREDQGVRGRTFSWGTLTKQRIGCNVKSSSMRLPIALQPSSVPSSPTPDDAANTKPPSSPTTASTKPPSSPTTANIKLPSSPTHSRTKPPSSPIPANTKPPSSRTPASMKLPSSPTPASMKLPSCLTPASMKLPSSSTHSRTKPPSSPTPASMTLPSSLTPASKKPPSSPTTANTLLPSNPTPANTKPPSSPTPANTLLPSSPTLDAGNHFSVNTTNNLPLCLFGIPGVISQVKQGSGGTEYAVTFTRMGETYEALMMKKYLSALMVDCVTETWPNVHEMLVPGLQVLIDVKNILFNNDRKWLVFGLYLGKLQRNEASNLVEVDASRKLKMKLKEANVDEDQVYSGVSLMKESESDNSFSDYDGAGDKTCDHKFDYSGAISEIDSTTFSFIGPFGERWINAKLSVAQTNLYVDGVRIQESSEKSSFLKKAKGAMGNLVISKCLKCSDFDLSDNNDLLINEACLAWFGIDNAPWLQGVLGKVSAFSSTNGGKDSLAILSLANSSSKVWYNLSQHTGPKLSINSEVLVWAFRECTEAYYIGAAVVVFPEKLQSQNLVLDGLTLTPLNDGKISTYRGSSNEMEEVFLEDSKMNDTGKSIDFEGATENGVKIKDVNYIVQNHGKMANPSKGSLSSVISPLDLESSLNDSELFSFKPYKEIENLKPCNTSTDGKQESSENLKPCDTSTDGKLESSAIRAQSRSFPSTTDSEYSEVDYRGTLAQIEAFKKMESVEKKVAFQPLLIENDVSNHLHAGFEIELVKTSDDRSTPKDGNKFKCHEDSADNQQEFDNKISAAEVEEFEDEVFSRVRTVTPNVINTEAKTASLDETSEVINNRNTNGKVLYGETENMENFDDSWKFEINKLLLRDDKIANQLESHDEFFKYAKLELTFGALVRDNSMMTLPDPIIDTQFEMILCVNDLDSPQLIYSQANMFDECFEIGDWTTTDSIERVGRFTVFGKDSPEKKSTSLLNNHDSADENVPRPERELSLPTAEHQTISSLNLLPPIPEEKETCSDAVSSDGSLSGTDGCEYSMSWTYTRAHVKTPSPTKIDDQALYRAQCSARSLSPTKTGAKTPPSTKTGARTPPSTKTGPKTSPSRKTSARTPPSTNLIRYTSTPHINNEEAILERKFSADSSSLIHSFAACDTDSGLGDSNNKFAFTENSPFSSDDQAKTSEIAFEEKNNGIETDLKKKPCFWHTPTPTDTVPKESSKLLIKENLKEFLSFTEFPEDRRSEVIERFMKSGKAIL